jgi:3-carboxy-cis,cis-muconate cycloisomerase
MMALGHHIGREHAHDLVYDLCRDAIRRELPLIDLLEKHPEIAPHVDRAALERMFDPAAYLGAAGPMVDAVLHHARAAR